MLSFGFPVNVWIKIVSDKKRTSALCFMMCFSFVFWWWWWWRTSARWRGSIISSCSVDSAQFVYLCRKKCNSVACHAHDNAKVNSEKSAKNTRWKCCKKQEFKPVTEVSKAREVWENRKKHRKTPHTHKKKSTNKYEVLSVLLIVVENCK